MNKLTIKDLAPYLGYNIYGKLSEKGIFNLDEEYPNPRKYELGIIKDISNYNDEISGCLYLKNNYSFDFAETDEIEIYLRPISDLIKEIDINSEKIIPIVEISKFIFGERDIIEYGKAHSYYYCETNNNINQRYNIIIDDYDYTMNITYSSTFERIKQYRASTSQLEYFNMLFEWNFDVYDLIGKGLAKDINSLNL